jgi:hypothetical protein
MGIHKGTGRLPQRIDAEASNGQPEPAFLDRLADIATGLAAAAAIACLAYFGAHYLDL